MICKDKTATSDLLDYHGVNCIRHRIFHGPKPGGYGRRDGNWRAMLAFLSDHPGGVVCKPNEGTGGNSVFLAKTPAQLEAAVHQVFSMSRSLCLSPFEVFEHEYRVALLAGGVQFVYRKVRPSLRGDGIRTVREHFMEFLGQCWNSSDTIAAVKSASELAIAWDSVPAAGTLVTLNWRHNLGQGAYPTMLTSTEPAWEAVTALAARAASVLGVELASVDIAATPDGLKILEINSGIMMESLEKNHPDGPALARRFYDRILCAALGIV